MPVLRRFLLLFGIFAMLVGLFWIGQGTGLVMWPASSFMLADSQWAINGGLLAAAGAALVWFARL